MCSCPSSRCNLVSRFAAVMPKSRAQGMLSPGCRPRPNCLNDRSTGAPAATTRSFSGRRMSVSGRRGGRLISTTSSTLLLVSILVLTNAFFFIGLSPVKCSMLYLVEDELSQQGPSSSGSSSKTSNLPSLSSSASIASSVASSMPSSSQELPLQRHPLTKITKTESNLLLAPAPPQPPPQPQPQPPPPPPPLSSSSSSSEQSSNIKQSKQNRSPAQETDDEIEEDGEDSEISLQKLQFENSVGTNHKQQQQQQQDEQQHKSADQSSQNELSQSYQSADSHSSDDSNTSDSVDDYFDHATISLLRSHLMSFKRSNFKSNNNNNNKAALRGYHHMVVLDGNGPIASFLGANNGIGSGSSLNCSHYSGSCHECFRRKRECSYLVCGGEHRNLCINSNDPTFYLSHSALYQIIGRCHMTEQCPLPKSKPFVSSSASSLSTSSSSLYHSFFSPNPNSPIKSSIANSRYQSLQKTPQRSIRVGDSSSKQFETSGSDSGKVLGSKMANSINMFGGRDGRIQNERSKTSSTSNGSNGGSKGQHFYHIGIGTVLGLMICSSLVVSAVITVAYKKIRKIYTTVQQKNSYGTLHEECGVNLES